MQRCRDVSADSGVEPDPSRPSVCLLSNGRYNVVLTEAGSGYSTHDGLDVTRWREDATCDCWGQHCYIRDLDGGRAWSAGRQPLGGDADDYEAILGSDRAVFRRRDADIETRYEVAVASDADAEVRRITVTNRRLSIALVSTPPQIGPRPLPRAAPHSMHVDQARTQPACIARSHSFRCRGLALYALEGSGNFETPTRDTSSARGLRSPSPPAFRCE